MNVPNAKVLYRRNRLDALQILHAFELTGSFKGAADLLCRVPTALTYTVRKLEAELGLTLFERVGRTLRVSPTGLQFLTEGKEVLQSLDILEEKMAYLAEGRALKLKLAHDSLIPFSTVCRVLGAFVAANPYSTLEVHEEVLQNTWAALVSGGADILIGAAGDGPRNNRFRRKLIGEVSFTFVAAPGHPLASATTPIDVSSVRQSVTVVPEASEPAKDQVLQIKGGSHIAVSSVASLIDSYVAGVSAGFAPTNRVARSLASGELVEVPVNYTVPPRPVYLAWRQSLPPYVTEFFINWFSSGERCQALLGYGPFHS